MANVVRGALTTGFVETVATSYAVLVAWAATGWILSAWIITRRR
jgi:hypothetical protein